MSEQQIQTNSIKWFKIVFPKAFIWKISDRWYSGIPDVFILMEGHFMFIEFKTEIGVVSKIQKVIFKIIENAGGTVKICRSVKEFQNEISDMTVRILRED